MNLFCQYICLKLQIHSVKNNNVKSKLFSQTNIKCVVLMRTIQIFTTVKTKIKYIFQIFKIIAVASSMFSLSVYCIASNDISI